MGLIPFRDFLVFVLAAVWESRPAPPALCHRFSTIDTMRAWGSTLQFAKLLREDFLLAPWLAPPVLEHFDQFSPKEEHQAGEIEPEQKAYDNSHRSEYGLCL
jgi:hypothetical protein